MMIECSETRAIIKPENVNHKKPPVGSGAVSRNTCRSQIAYKVEHLTNANRVEKYAPCDYLCFVAATHSEKCAIVYSELRKGALAAIKECAT